MTDSIKHLRYKFAARIKEAVIAFMIEDMGLPARRALAVWQFLDEYDTPAQADLINGSKSLFRSIAKAVRESEGTA
jgi:hypothetical protein